MKKWQWFLVPFLVFIVLITGYCTYLYVNVQSTFTSIQLPITEKIETPSKSPVRPSEPPPPISILLLGIDQWESVGRADTIVVLTVNAQNETVKMLSIPRDTYTKIAGIDRFDKINHSYSFGGLQTAHSTVETLLEIPIDYVVSINMEGFIELVDILDGVIVDNDMPFSTEQFEFTSGQLNLSGGQALDYVRMRKEDPQGDFGRQQRQRQVIESIVNKTKSFNVVWRVPPILEAVGQNIETNITFDEMKKLASFYKPAFHQMEQLTFEHGDGRFENGIWYYFLNEDELNDIRMELKKNLHTPESDMLENKTCCVKEF